MSYQGKYLCGLDQHRLLASERTPKRWLHEALSFIVEGSRKGEDLTIYSVARIQIGCA